MVKAAASIRAVLVAFLQVGMDEFSWRHMRNVGSSRDLGPDLMAAAANQPLIGRDQRHVWIDPDPAVAGEHLHVEMQMAGGAVGMVEIVRHHAELLAFRYTPPTEEAVGVHDRGVHVHVAEADMLVVGVDLQRRRLLLRGADDGAVADGGNRLLLGIAGAGGLPRRQASAGTDVLALVPEAAGALPDAEAARLAEIIPPGIKAGWMIRSVARTAPEGLRMNEGRRLQREADLRIGDQVGAAAPPARAAVGDDVAGGAIA